MSYHLPIDKINTFTPQTYRNIYIGNSSIYSEIVDIHLSRHELVPPFRYIIQANEVYHLVRGGKLLRDMKYLMRSVKQTAEELGIWTEYNWDVKIVNLLYTMVSGRFNFKINKRFDSLI